MTFKELYTELDQLHIMADWIESKEGDIRMYEPTLEDLIQEEYELKQSSLVYPGDVDLIMEEQQKEREDGNKRRLIIPTQERQHCRQCDQHSQDNEYDHRAFVRIPDALCFLLTILLHGNPPRS